MTDAPIVYIPGISEPPPTATHDPVPFTNEGIPKPFATAEIPKTNWRQQIEMTAKADIIRLEGKLTRVCGSLSGTLAVAVVAFLVACAALFKSCH